MKTRPLPTTIKSSQFTLTQIARHRNKAIYAQFHPTRPSPIAYEAIIIQSHPPNPRFPNPESFDLTESYPSPESWGTLAWTTHSPTQAAKKLGWHSLHSPKSKDAPEPQNHYNTAPR